MPIQKPEFVNVSLPVDTLPLKDGSVLEENFDTDSKSAELDTNYQVSIFSRHFREKHLTTFKKNSKKLFLFFKL